jgi:large conductance mechanosensitive channel
MANPTNPPAPEKHEPSRVTKWAQGFRAFIMRGNVVDLAVGVMIGAAFGKIVTSFVNDIVTPPLGLALGKVKFSELKWQLPGDADPPVTINYGVFIQHLIDFILVAFVLFLLISLVNRIHRKPPPTPAEMSLEQKLLTEIRDELKTRNAPPPQSAPSI